MDLNPEKSAILISKDGTYKHNLTTIAEKVSRVTMFPVQQAYLFLRRFVNSSAGGQRYGINQKIARELNLKPSTSYIPLSLRNVYEVCPEPEQVRNKALRRDFKTAVLSKAHQAVLTLMFIKTVKPDVDMAKIEAECAVIFDHYLPDISLIANGELEIVEAKDESESKNDNIVAAGEPNVGINVGDISSN